MSFVATLTCISIILFALEVLFAILYAREKALHNDTKKKLKGMTEIAQNTVRKIDYARVWLRSDTRNTCWAIPRDRERALSSLREVIGE